MPNNWVCTFSKELPSLRLPDSLLRRSPPFAALNIQGRTMKKYIFAILVSISSISYACDEAVEGSRILIKEISPSISNTLEIGHDYNVSIKAKYQTPQPSGSVSLIIQRSEPGYPPLCSKSSEIKEGEGIVELSCFITLPNTPTLTIFVPLYSGVEGCKTQTVDSRVFETVDSRKIGKI